MLPIVFEMNWMLLRVKKNVIMRPHRVLLCLCFLMGLFTPWSTWGAQETTPPSSMPSAPAVVAEGTDGFRVTEKDVQELIDFFTTHTMFQTSEKEYRRYTVQTFLFAREAEKKGISLPEGAESEDPIQKTLTLANAYLEHRLKNLPLEPEAVQSFYRAFPERFLKAPGAKKWRTEARPFYEESDLLPLADVSQQIENYIRAQLKRRVEAEAFQELMVAYNVVMR